MDAITFGLGALGALLTLYVAKQTIVPEFRPLYDTKDKILEADGHRGHAKDIEKDINTIQEQMKNGKTLDEVERLKPVLTSFLQELRIERTRIQKLESEILWGQIISRSLGFFFYVVIGGVFGSLLAGYVKIEGLTGNLPNLVESLVIGATWTTYISTIGLPSLDKQFKEEQAAAIDAVTKNAQETELILKKEVDESAQKREELAKMLTDKDTKIQLLETDCNNGRKQIQSLLIDLANIDDNTLKQKIADTSKSFEQTLRKYSAKDENEQQIADAADFYNFKARDVWDLLTPKLEAQSKKAQAYQVRTDKLTRRILGGV